MFARHTTTREEAMKLYWAPRSRAIRAVWMLEEAGAPYERVLVDIENGEQARPEFRAVNPMMKVPALTDGAATVAESAAICAYVADRVPDAGLAPPIGDPLRGAYYRWLFFSPACIEPALAQKVTGMELRSSAAGWGSYERVVDVLEAALTPGPWILGERFSAADVMLGADLHFAVELFRMIDPRPAFAAYLERCTARPAFARAQEIQARALA
jgi:glutathione S-transferase